MSRSNAVDYAEVARIAREANAAGVSIMKAVSRHMACNHGTARQRILRARRLGFDLPETAWLVASRQRQAVSS